ncbi:MAG TPA: hypothetical protein VJS47_12595 [Rhizomicrobium sp.]|nr:hypothetical protein [Rhizomicrobium sp.]
MMITLSRLYSDDGVARAVVDELKTTGLPEDDIGIIAPSHSLARSARLENAGQQNSHLQDAYLQDASDRIGRDGDGRDDRGRTVNRSAGIGAALGGAAGLLAGLGAFVLPGIGAVVAAGWLASALAGAVAGGAAGGVVGALIEAGISENDAAGYAEGVRHGGTLVTIRVMSQDRAFYQDILTGHGAPALRGDFDPAGMPGQPRDAAGLHVKRP